MLQAIQNPVSIRNQEWKITDGLLNDLGWGVLLVSVGVVWLIPSGHLPSGTWMMVAGIVVLLFSVARFIHRLPVSWFALAVGILALIAGIAMAINVHIPIFPIGMIVIGLCMLLTRGKDGSNNSSKDEQEGCCR